MPHAIKLINAKHTPNKSGVEIKILIKDLIPSTCKASSPTHPHKKNINLKESQIKKFWETGRNYILCTWYYV